MKGKVGTRMYLSSLFPKKLSNKIKDHIMHWNLKLLLRLLMENVKIFINRCSLCTELIQQFDNS